MNADGTEQRNFSNNSCVDAEPVWSPDGKRIAYVSDRDGFAHIYIAAVDEPERPTQVRIPADVVLYSIDSGPRPDH
jgi:Tol biopolymer transport system component